MNSLMENIKQVVISGKYKEIEPLIEQAIREGTDLDQIISEALIAAMDVVGERFGTGEIFVPEMLVSARTMKMALDIIKPRLTDRGGQSRGRVILCTVKGDLHDIGKNLVGMMLEGAGFEVIDLGVNATVETVVSKIDELQPQVLGLSALLTTTLPEMQRVIAELESRAMREKVKVIIGGAPVNEGFAKEIGADAYGQDAGQAVSKVRDLIKGISQ